MKRRILSVLIAVILLVCSASCGSEEQSLLKENISDAVYRFHPVEISFKNVEMPPVQDPRGMGSPEGMEEFPEGMEEFPEGMEEVPEGMEEFPEGMEGVPEGMEEVPEGIEGAPEDGEPSPAMEEMPEKEAASEETESAEGFAEEGSAEEGFAEEAFVEDGSLDEELLEETERSEVKMLFTQEDRLYAIVSRDTMVGSFTYLFSCSGAGDDQEFVYMDMYSEASGDQDDLAGSDLRPSYDSFCAGENGIFYALGSVSNVDEATGQELQDYYLTCFSADGTREATWKLPVERPADGYYWLQGMSYLGNGRFVFVDNKYIFGFDTRNKRRWNIYEGQEYMDASISVLRGGSVLMGKNGDKGYEFYELDVETGKLGDQIEIMGSFYGSMITGITHDAFFYASRAIWYFDKKGSKTGKIVDLTASDMLVDDVSGFVEMQDGKIALLSSSWSENGRSPSLYIGEHVPAEQVRNKKEITISCVFADSGIMRKVVEFNRQSDEYRIRVADYSEYESDDWSYPYTKLNTDIVSGHIPDMILIDDMLPMESYISKGILADISPLMEADEAISGGEYLENVFDTYRINGALYQIIPSFIVYTGVLRSDVLHGRTTLPMREFREICEEQGVQMRDAFGGMTRSQLMSMLLYIQGMEYVDLATGRCAFDSQAFLDLLELLAQFPEEEDKSDFAERQKAYREGRSILMLYGLSSFSDYANLRYGNFGTDITMIGIPGGSTSGSVIIPQMQIAMTTSTKYPDVVWEFMRSFLLDEYQDKITWGFPVRMENLMKKAEEAKQRPYYLDENGKKVEYDNTWWVAGQEVVIPPMTDEEISKVISFLKGCDRRAFNNSTVTNIINEESAAFFEGQKTAEEAAKIIQSRARIYVHENR